MKNSKKGKNRYINTDLWNDPWFQELDIVTDRLFIFLLTCPKSSIAGIFEISLRDISNLSKLSIADVESGFKRLATDKKVFHIKNHVVIINFIKHQAVVKNGNINMNLEKGIQTIFENLPDGLFSGQTNVLDLLRSKNQLEAILHWQQTDFDRLYEDPIMNHYTPSNNTNLNFNSNVNQNTNPKKNINEVANASAVTFSKKNDKSVKSGIFSLNSYIKEHNGILANMEHQLSPIDESLICNTFRIVFKEIWERELRAKIDNVDNCKYETFNSVMGCLRQVIKSDMVTELHNTLEYLEEGNKDKQNRNNTE